MTPSARLHHEKAVDHNRISLHIETNKKRKSLDVVFDREAIGRLRRELSWTVGEARAQGILARVGYSCGVADALHTADADRLIRGLADLIETTSENRSDEFVFETGNSCEAQEHLRFFSTSREPQCALMAGYLTGLVSTKTGRALYFLETQCCAKEGAVCRFVGKPRDAWAPDSDLALDIYREDNMALELASSREQLKLTKDRYQNLFEQSGQPIFIIDPETGALMDINIAAEELTGHSKEDLLRMNVFDLCETKEHHRMAEHVKLLTASSQAPDLEISIVRKDGNRRSMAVTSKSLTYGGQAVIQTVMRDVTGIKVAEQTEKDLQAQLLRSERLSSIGRLAAGVAHEIKNPLGAIRNALYYIRNALTNNPVLETDPQIKEIMKLAEDEVDGAVTIIEELLDFSRVVQLIPRRTQINELLELMPTILNIPDNIDVEFDLDITLPSATVDPDRLRQVFCNIANNAMQAMPQGGKLKIRSRHEVETSGETGLTSDIVTVAFEDTGGGIHPHHLKKIFEPLFTTKARGTGLGLAITNNIVEKHGGAIIVASQVGKGTTFTVKLPLHTPMSSEDEHGDQKNTSR